MRRPTSSSLMQAIKFKSTVIMKDDTILFKVISQQSSKLFQIPTCTKNNIVKRNKIVMRSKAVL